MSIMLSKTYDAFRSASGATDEQARAAVEELAAFDVRLRRVDIELKRLVTVGASTLVGVGLILLRLFVFD